MDNTLLTIIIILIGLLFTKDLATAWFKKFFGIGGGSDESRFDNIDQNIAILGNNHMSHVQDSLDKIEHNTSEMCRKVQSINDTLSDVQNRVINMQTDGVRRKNGNK